MLVAELYLRCSVLGALKNDIITLVPVCVPLSYLVLRSDSV